MTSPGDEIQSLRLQMSRYERLHPWLTLLLDCYAVIDYSVAEAVARSEKKTACRKGCSACCGQIIPVSIIEASGIKFYIHNILRPQSRLLLAGKSGEHRSACLFNIGNCCTVYPMRPISCRRYIILSQPCSLNEEPLLSRPDDVPEPSREYLYRAVALTLPFYHALGIRRHGDEHVFDFYKRYNVALASIADSLLHL
jgi:hypothetical protein